MLGHGYPPTSPTLFFTNLKFGSEVATAANRESSTFGRLAKARNSIVPEFMRYLNFT
jgi:hypothetical protein